MFILLAVAVATFVLYWRVKGFEFVHYDDWDYVGRNPMVRRGLTWAGVAWAFTSFEASNWHPLTWLSHMVDVQVYGLEPGPHHLTNVLLHVLNAALLYMALFIMTRSSWRSGLVTALFALHPLHVESVAWVAERKDVLSTLFILLGLIAYIRYVRTGRRLHYGLTLGTLALSLASKPMYVTFPFLLLLLDYWPLARWSRAATAQANVKQHKRAAFDNKAVSASALLVEKIPFLALSAASSLITVVAQRQGGAIRDLVVAPLHWRVANAAASYVDYIRDMIWPARLAVLYPFRMDIPALKIVVAALVLAAITVFAVQYARRFPHLIVGWFWFLGTLVPVIGIVKVGEAARADRYTYFSLIGLFIVLAWSIPEPVTRVRKRVIAAVSAVALVLLSIVTWKQVGYWENTFALFNRSMAVAGETETARLNLAWAYADRGEYVAADRENRRALQLNEKSHVALNNLGNNLVRAGQYEEALKYYDRVLALRADYVVGHYNRGLALGYLNRLEEAEAAFRKALELKPDFPEAQQNLDYALTLQGKK